VLTIGLLLAGISIVLLAMSQYQRGQLRQLRRAQRSTTKELAAFAESVSQALVETGNYSQVVEMAGVIRCDEPLISEIAKQPCVYYDAQVSREYEETRHLSSRRAKRRSSKTRRGSEMVSNNSQRIPFWVEDSVGRILVDPTNAEIEPIQIADRFESAETTAGGSLKIGGFSITLSVPSPWPESGRRTIGYRLRERTLPVGRRVYVLGEVTDASGELTVQKPRGKGRFLVSLRSKEELMRSASVRAQWLTATGAGSGVASVAMVAIGLLTG
jgi:hypothetical protein